MRAKPASRSAKMRQKPDQHRNVADRHRPVSPDRDKNDRQVQPSENRSSSSKLTSRAAAHRHLQAAIEDLGLPDEFSEEAIAAAENLREIAPDKATARDRRRDLRSQPHITIDDEDAQDFDDAVAATREGSSYRVWVSIADVAYYIKARSPLDREAALRGTSIYLPTRVLPMLPERLSNHLCSLLPGVPRLTLTCEMVVDKNGSRSEVEIYPSLICSAARLTYKQVQGHMENVQESLPATLSEPLDDLVAASMLLRKHRFKRGSLDLEIPEPQILFDRSGNPVSAVARAPLPAHQVIEDLMIAANESVAEFLLDRGLVGIYRVHPPPPREKWLIMAGWAKRFGLPVKTGKANTPRAVARLLEQLKQSRQSETGQMLLLRSLSQAYYSANCDIHFGLASEAYAHFTSPIRRYPDLLVHRALWNHWLKKPNMRALESRATSSSETERLAIKAERDIVHLAACLVARRHVGEVMKARIVGIHSAGLFVRPDDLYAEGLVPIRSLGQQSEDFFEVWVEAQAIVGRRTRITYTLGNTLSVQLVQVDIDKRRINYEVSEDGELTTSKKPTSSRTKRKLSTYKRAKRKRR